MQVASLELCKELYSWSEWEGTANWWVKADDEKSPTILAPRSDDTTDYWTYWPAYDLGYLIRKLPRCTNIYLGTYEKAWAVYTALSEYAVEADTPEDAACKLAIELFKQGILTKEATGKEER